MSAGLTVLLLASVALGALRLPGMWGEIAVYPWLGFFPGLALAAWASPRQDLLTRSALALSVSPLLSAAAGWALVRAGLPFPAAALAVAIAGWLACGLTLFRRGGPPPESAGVPRAAVIVAVALGLVLLLVPVINPYIFIRGDSWLHGGFVMELRERGFPPQDTRMAGVPLNYVWFYNLFIALLGSLQDQDIFRFMTLLNAADGFATVALVALLTQRLWRNGRATVAASLLLVLGLNAGAWLLWPLGLVRAWTGSVTGMAEVVRMLESIEIGKARIIYSLSAPFAEMVSFLDKLLVGTALNIAYVYMALFLWALVRWLGDGRRDALAWLALGAAGMMFFHSVVGLSVIPVALAVLGAAWLMRGSWSWLPSRGALLAAAVSAGAGALLSLPYMRSITAGWAPEKAGFHHRYLEFHPEMIWTLATACFFALWFVRRPLADVWRRREPLALLLAAWTAGMAVFACAVSLPMHNSVKFVLEFFVGCLALAAPAAAEGVAASWKSRRVLAPVALFLIFGVPTLLTLHGYLVDPTGRTRAELHPRTGEESVYAWLRHETPLDAVLVDGGFRDLIMVKARRRLYMATEQPADLAAFPVAEMARRHRIMLDLYGSIAEPDTDVAGLADLHQPIYLLFRPEDRSMWLEPWKRVIDAAPGSQLVYDRDGYRIVRLFARSVS